MHIVRHNDQYLLLMSIDHFDTLKDNDLQSCAIKPRIILFKYICSNMICQYYCKIDVYYAEDSKDAT